MSWLGGLEPAPPPKAGSARVMRNDAPLPAENLLDRRFAVNCDVPTWVGDIT